MKHERAWHTEPPDGRVWALLFCPRESGGGTYQVAQWDPHFKAWAFETHGTVATITPEYVYWYPLPKPPKPYAVHAKTHALENT